MAADPNLFPENPQDALGAPTISGEYPVIDPSLSYMVPDSDRLGSPDWWRSWGKVPAPSTTVTPDLRFVGRQSETQRPLTPRESGNQGPQPYSGSGYDAFDPAMYGGPSASSGSTSGTQRNAIVQALMAQTQRRNPASPIPPQGPPVQSPPTYGGEMGVGAPSSYIPQDYATQPSMPAGGGQFLAHNLPQQLVPSGTGGPGYINPNQTQNPSPSIYGGAAGIGNPSAAFVPSQPDLRYLYNPAIGGAEQY